MNLNKLYMLYRNIGSHTQQALNIESSSLLLHVPFANNKGFNDKLCARMHDFFMHPSRRRNKKKTYSILHFGALGTLVQPFICSPKL